MAAVATHGQSLANVPLGRPIQTSTFHKHAFTLRKRVALRYVLRVQSQAGFGRGTVKVKDEEGEVDKESEPSSGTKKLFNLPGTPKLPGTVKLQERRKPQVKSNKLVFVAGATGKVGSRTVRELLKLGFSVRAGTRNVEKAQALFEDVARGGGPANPEPDDASPFGFLSPAKLFGFLKPKSGKALEIVECDLEDAESIEAAVGNAGVVVCCIGASEKEVLDVSGPYRIDFKATANLIDAASSAQVDHFVLLTSLGTQKLGFPAAVLNLFWGVLVWKAKAEKALLQSGIPYTIVRPGGMERPTDAYKETHNLILGEADRLFGGQVSNLQVAELIASIVENPDVSVNKIVEAVAETTAPLRPIREMLEEISVKGESVPRAEPQSTWKPKPAKADVAPQKPSKKQEEEKMAAEKRALALKEREEKRNQAEKLAEEKLAKAQKEEEEKRIRAENEQKEKLKLQALRKKYEEEIEAAKEEEEKANSAAAAALAEKAELEKKVAEIRSKAEAAALAASQAKAVQAAVVAAARKGNVLSDAEKEKIMESVRIASLPKEDSSKLTKPSLKKKPGFSLFGIAAPSTETDVEPSKETKEEEAKLDVEPKIKAKADKKAATKVPEQKKQEEKVGKDEEAKKLAEQEAAKKLEAKQKEEQEAKQKKEQEKLEREAKEAKKLAEQEAAKKLEAKQKEEQETKQKEEQEKLEREAKEQAERNAAEAKRKEQEAKKKEEEAEAKAKKLAEQEAAKELEAKLKEEQETKQEEQEKLEKEAKEKAEQIAAEAKQKEAEAKMKEEEAEAKRKEEEAEEKKQLAEEAKKKAEQEKAERIRLEAEAKAKEVAEQEAAAAEAEKAPAQSRPKGFRWFWQPAEPDTTEEEQVTKVTDEQLPQCSRPLSPYTRYPGLKPPSPPAASPSLPTAKAEKVETAARKPLEINRVEQTAEDVGALNKKEAEVGADKQSPESQEDIDARARLVQETAAREREALERAQAAVTFKWPWQKSDSAEEPSVLSSSNERESITSSVPEPKEKPASKNDILLQSSRPLSPYAQFPGLKPPVPPRPSLLESNSSENDIKGADSPPNSSTPLSPFPGFPDLKPPTTPAPLQDEATNGAVPESTVETVEKVAETVSSSEFKWPWQQ